MQKKIIGLVVPSLESNGGVETIVEALLNQIKKSTQYSYILISLATSATDECSTRILMPATLFRGVKVKIVQWRGQYVQHVGCSLVEFEFMRYRQRYALKRALAKCDLIQVIGGFPAWGWAVLDCHKPVAIWAATRCIWERGKLNSMSFGIFAKWRLLMTGLVNYLDKDAIRRADCILVMNKLLFNYAAKEKAPFNDRVLYAPPGVDVSWFRPNKQKSPDDNCRNNPYILTVGRFSDPRKNLELLIEAYAIALKKSLHFPSLILAGDSPPSNLFWEKVDYYGLRSRVSFELKPDKSRLRELYQNSICFALSSDEEGFGMVIIEAMACGIPVVATRCGGPDDIIVDGETGFLVPVGDANLFADKMSLVCGDTILNMRLGNMAREVVLNRFSINAMSKVFFSAWEKMLNLEALKK
jgi:glycosyltransferase involved in cell wall biosynthesis